MITKIKSTTKSQKTKSKKRAINDKKMQSDHSEAPERRPETRSYKTSWKKFFLVPQNPPAQHSLLYITSPCS